MRRLVGAGFQTRPASAHPVAPFGLISQDDYSVRVVGMTMKVSSPVVRVCCARAGWKPAPT
jgi:hypothetical protein